MREKLDFEHWKYVYDSSEIKKEIFDLRKYIIKSIKEGEITNEEFLWFSYELEMLNFFYLREGGYYIFPPKYKTVHEKTQFINWREGIDSHYERDLKVDDLIYWIPRLYLSLQDFIYNWVHYKTTRDILIILGNMTEFQRTGFFFEMYDPSQLVKTKGKFDYDTIIAPKYSW